MIDGIFFFSDNDEATGAFGKCLARLLRPGMAVALTGDLGAGKTVFCRGVARGFGVAGHIPSPTFTLVQEYPLADGNVLYHTDMYRIADEQAALDFGIDEYLGNPRGISLIEWSERIDGLLDPRTTLRLDIRHQDETTRLLAFSNWPEELAAIPLPAGIRLCKDDQRI